MTGVSRVHGACPGPHAPRGVTSILGAVEHTPLVSLDRLTQGVEGKILAKLCCRDESRQFTRASADDGGAGRRSGVGRAGFRVAAGAGFRSGSPTGRRGDMGNRGPTGGFPGGPVLSSRKCAGAFAANRSGDPPPGRPIDGFCDFAGTGGTFAGISQCLRAAKPDTRCYLVEPETAPVLAGRPDRGGGHRIQGGGYSLPNLPALEGVTVDGFVTVSDEEAMQTARALAKREGLFCGFSSGANVCAAVKLLRGSFRGKTLVVVCCDSGLKYLSTDLWAPPS